MIDLAYMRPVIEIRAAALTKECPHLFDDAVQEGLIAAWEASQKTPGKEDVYYRAAAYNGVRSVVRGRSFTGAPSRQGRKDAHDVAGPLVVTAADGTEFLVAEPACPASERGLSTVEIADEVLAAVDGLPTGLDVAIAYGRYWLDLSFADLAKILGRPAGTLSRRWTEIIRPALRHSLAAHAA